MAADPLVNHQANNLRVQHVEKCFGTNGAQLRKEGRVLLGEGVLTKACRKGHKPRQFFLFNDILVYGCIKQDKRKYSKQHIIPLSEICVMPLPDSREMKNAWQISSARKSFILMAATSREKAEWIQHMCAASKRAPVAYSDEMLADYAPAWVPDVDAKHCMSCLRSGKEKKFSAVTRRHHCRNCGEVVCGPCSSKRLLIPKQSTKPLRVCMRCYDSGDPSKQRNAPDMGSTTTSTPSDDDSDDDEEEEMAIAPVTQAAAANVEPTGEEYPTVFYEESSDKEPVT